MLSPEQVKAFQTENGEILRVGSDHVDDNCLVLGSVSSALVIESQISAVSSMVVVSRKCVAINPPHFHVCVI